MTIKEPEKVEETWDTLLRWFKEKKITPTVFDPIYDGLDQMPKALDDLLARKTCECGGIWIEKNARSSEVRWFWH